MSDGENERLFTLTGWQVLVQILKPFTTHDLLPLTAVSHRFHALILRILHYRLFIVAALEEYKLILECYHPSCKATEPYLLCTYLGTNGLSDKHEGQGLLYEDCGSTGQLGRLGALYSRFRPKRVDGEQRLRGRRHGPPILAVDGGAEASSSSTTGMGSGANAAPGEDTKGNNALVSHTVILDEFEVFSQLCAVANLVHRSAFPTCVNLMEGVVRLWRGWLAEQARLQERFAEQAKDTEEVEEEISAFNVKNHVDVGNRQDSDPLSEDQRILWVDGKRNIGLKVRVCERKLVRGMHILVHQDDNDVAVSYEIRIRR